MMSKEERNALEVIAYAYLILEGLLPEEAKRKIDNMTDKQLENYIS